MNPILVHISRILLTTFGKFTVLAMFWLGSAPDTLASSIGCDDDFVQLNQVTLVIKVTANGVDDTNNIQCALDAAASGGYPIVRLAPTTYFTSALLVKNFKGTFEGTTKATTIIEVLDHSIDCDAMRTAGMQHAVIKFVGGEPRLRYMTIRADQSCMEDGQQINALLNFTGESALAGDCDNDVIFGVVDRVILDSNNNDTGPRTAVLVFAESRNGNVWGCKDTLLGTFKLNRVEIINSYFGIRISMQAGAQVDMNFNEFRNNREAIQLYNTNQNTSITTNKLFGNNPAVAPYVGIEILTLPGAPLKTRVVVHNNEFNIDSFQVSLSRRAIVAAESGGIANVSTVITGNLFNLDGTWTHGIWMNSISNGHVSANRFSGSNAKPIDIGGNTPVTGWTITANNGLENFSQGFSTGISLGTSTSLCIVGAGQGVSVADKGTNNTILPQ